MNKKGLLLMMILIGTILIVRNNMMNSVFGLEINTTLKNYKSYIQTEIEADKTEYSKLDELYVPYDNYKLSEETSACVNDGTLEFDEETQNYTLKTTKSDVCNVYLDKILEEETE